MKFCGNCGTQLEDSALFCGQCGMKQVYQIQQQVQPQQIQQQPIQQQYAQPQQVQQYYAQPQQQNSGKTKKRKSGKKKYVLVPLFLLLLVAIGFGAFFMFFDKDKSSGSKKNSKGGNNAQGSEEKVLEDVLDDYGSHGSQEQVLDEYFQDLSNMDFDAIVKLNSPKSDEMYNVGLDQVTLAEMLTQMYNYPRSLTIDNSSYMLLNTEVGDIFLKSYGFPGYEEGGMDEYRKTNQDNDLFREKHKDFKAEYELISLKSASSAGDFISMNSVNFPVSLSLNPAVFSSLQTEQRMTASCFSGSNGTVARGSGPEDTPAFLA